MIPYKIKLLIVKFMRFVYTNNHLVIFGISSTKENNAVEDDHIIKVFPDNREPMSSLTFLYEETKNAIVNELDKGSIVYIFSSETHCVMHYSCLADSIAIGEIKKNISMPEKSGYIYNCFTEKQHRGKGLYRQMLSHIIKTSGLSDYYIACIYSNNPSMKVIKRIGFIPQTDIHYYCFFGMVFRTVTNTEFYKKYFP